MSMRGERLHPATMWNVIRYLDDGKYYVYTEYAWSASYLGRAMSVEFCGGRYTAEQIEDIVERLEDAIADGAISFTFPAA